MLRGDDPEGDGTGIGSDARRARAARPGLRRAESRGDHAPANKLCRGLCPACRVLRRHCLGRELHAELSGLCRAGSGPDGRSGLRHAQGAGPAGRRSQQLPLPHPEGRLDLHLRPAEQRGVSALRPLRRGPAVAGKEHGPGLPGACPDPGAGARAAAGPSSAAGSCRGADPARAPGPAGEPVSDCPGGHHPSLAPARAGGGRAPARSPRAGDCGHPGDRAASWRRVVRVALSAPLSALQGRGGGAERRQL